MSYGAGDTATVLVDHETLHHLMNAVGGRRAALIGWNETTKHLINLMPDNIAAIYDENEWTHGIRFRGKRVSKADERFDIDLIAVCDYAQIYAMAGRIRRLYDRQIKVYVPPRAFYKPTEEINVFEQDPLYTSIARRLHEAPPSMMEMKKQLFLAEMMRAGLKQRGDIIEVGVYQAGSVWYLANVLKNLGEVRHFYMMDVFETHMMHPNATMVNDEINRRLAFYPRTTMLEGLCDDEQLLSQIRGRPMCFVHYDLGFHERCLEVLWDCLTPGSPMVLDNYGHLAIDPWDLDDFFADRGVHVVRNAWSEQGFVFKP
jgi:hypothetical protein